MPREKKMQELWTAVSGLLALISKAYCNFSLWHHQFIKAELVYMYIELLWFYATAHHHCKAYAKYAGICWKHVKCSTGTFPVGFCQTYTWHGFYMHNHHLHHRCLLKDSMSTRRSSRPNSPLEFHSSIFVMRTHQVCRSHTEPESGDPRSWTFAGGS